MPHGLVEWQKFLIDKSFPVLRRTKLDVQDLIDQSQLSITQYAGPILFDASFSAYLFKRVNTERIKAGRNPLTTLENALSHLGQTVFQDVLNQAVVFEDLKLADKNVQGYMRVMGQSCHAALQSKSWAEQSNTAQYDEIYLATLLQNITELMLWCYADNVMPQIEKVCYVDKTSYEIAATQILGCGMRELGAALADKCFFPEMATDGLKSMLGGFTLSTGVALAAEVARIVDINWYGSNAIDVIQRIAKYRGKAEGEVERSLHLTAVSVTDVLLTKHYLAAARLLPQLPDDEYIDPQFMLQMESLKVEAIEGEKKGAANKSNDVGLDAIKARAEAIRKARTGNRAADIKTPDSIRSYDKRNIKTSPVAAADLGVTVGELKQPAVIAPDKKPAVSHELAMSIQVFKKMVSQGKSSQELIEHIVKSMLYCGVERCVFVMKLPDKKILVSRYMAQASDDIAMRQLQIPINIPHVFSLLMEKTRNIFINENNRKKYWNLIPGPVKLVLGVESFFAMSVFANEQAVGLMYADKVHGELTTEEYVKFQAVCRLLSNGIVESASLKKTQ